jgi:hypothetical protein
MDISILWSQITLNHFNVLLYSQPPCVIIRTTDDYFLLPYKIKCHPQDISTGGQNSAVQKWQPKLPGKLAISSLATSQLSLSLSLSSHNQPTCPSSSSLLVLCSDCTSAFVLINSSSSLILIRSSAALKREDFK